MPCVYNLVLQNRMYDFAYTCIHFLISITPMYICIYSFMYYIASLYDVLFNVMWKINLLLVMISNFILFHDNCIKNYYVISRPNYETFHNNQLRLIIIFISINVLIENVNSLIYFVHKYIKNIQCVVFAIFPTNKI